MNIRRESFGPDEIVIPPRLRDRLDGDTVTGLMASIEKIGLRTPITVRWDGEGDEARIVLVAGRHRLEACRRLGFQLVDCAVFAGTETEARLWEIAENLHRADLTVQERAEHIAEWVKLTVAEQSAQVAPKASIGHRPQSGINAAVRELGIDRTEAQRAVKIASLSDEAKAAAREFGLADNQSALLAAARSNDAVQTIHEIAERRAVKPAPAPLNDFETEEVWRTAFFRVWNRGAREWRERVLEEVDTPVFDRGAA